MSKYKNNSQKGFTIIELIIATTVFSVVLVMVSTMIIQIGKMYYKGITMSVTQQTTSTISDDVSRAVQFSGGTIDSSSDEETATRAYCIGGIRYTYVTNKQQNDGGHVLWRDEKPSDSCSPADYSQPLNNGREMIGSHMRLLQFEVTPLNGASAARVQVSVAYGDNDLLTSYDNNGTNLVDANGDGAINEADIASATCRSLTLGGSFCAVSGLTTIVKKRLN